MEEQGEEIAEATSDWYPTESEAEDECASLLEEEEDSITSELESEGKEWAKEYHGFWFEEKEDEENGILFLCHGQTTIHWTKEETKSRTRNINNQNLHLANFVTSDINNDFDSLEKYDSADLPDINDLKLDSHLISIAFNHAKQTMQTQLAGQVGILRIKIISDIKIDASRLIVDVEKANVIFSLTNEPPKYQFVSNCASSRPSNYQLQKRTEYYNGYSLSITNKIQTQRRITGEMSFGKKIASAKINYMFKQTSEFSSTETYKAYTKITDVETREIQVDGGKRAEIMLATYDRQEVYPYSGIIRLDCQFRIEYGKQGPHELVYTENKWLHQILANDEDKRVFKVSGKVNYHSPYTKFGTTGKPEDCN